MHYQQFRPIRRLKIMTSEREPHFTLWKVGSGLLVTEEMVRGIHTESAEAIKFWFGVSANAVWNWRRAFNVGQWDTEGSRRLHQALSENGAAKLRGKKLP